MSNQREGNDLTDVPSNELPSCCQPAPARQGQGFLLGIFYGLVPHTFCIAFIVLSVVGATAATSVVKDLLFLPFLFPLLVALSILFATLSAAFYLRRNRMLSVRGAASRWRYLSVMYSTTLAVNLLFFGVVFPAVTNATFAAPPAAASVAGAAPASGEAAGDLEKVSLSVDIPCSGHGPLIVTELQAVAGVRGVEYRGGSQFEVSYEPAVVSLDEILAIEVFQAYPARVQP